MQPRAGAARLIREYILHFRLLSGSFKMFCEVHILANNINLINVGDPQYVGPGYCSYDHDST